MIYKQRTLILICGALFSFCALHSAHAQNQAPFNGVSAAPSIQPIPRKEAAKEPEPIAPTAAQNPYLDTYLALQQQIALLAKLLERENSIGQMVDSYKTMGVAYEPPKPERAVCHAVPENMSCAVAYPDEYADFLPPPAPAPEMPAVVVSDLPQPIAELSPDQGIKELVWTDITCKGSICRAVITPNADNRGARYAIKVGDVLPSGGIVESISAAGVFISSGSKIITLSPAPLSSFALSAKANSPS